MTYKEYYLSLNSPEEIKTMANADMAFACVINPDRISIIRQSANEAIREKFGEESKERRIYIPEKAKNELLNLLNYIGITSGFAIVDRSGKQYKTRAFQSILQSLAEETKIDNDLMHPHGFRHFFAKEFIRNHNDICLLADLLGHSNLETTRIYLKMTSREQSEIVNKVVDW